MTLAWAPPDVNEFVIAWLLPLGDLAGVGMERPTNAVLPYRMVNRVSGSDDKVFETNIVSVHTFATSDSLEQMMAAAETAAMQTHYRMLQLAPPLVAQQPVTISTGTVMADCVETVQSPVWVDYEDNTIRRFVARYRVDLRFLAR